MFAIARLCGRSRPCKSGVPVTTYLKIGMDDHLKEELVARFRGYLDQQDDGETTNDDAEADQFTLLTELAGLKSEVRLEARQFKAALNDFREAFTALDRSNREIAARFADLRQKDAGQEQVPCEAVIPGLMELHDRLADALAGEDGKGSAPVFSFFCRRLVRRYRSHLKGLQMLLDRVLSLLADCDVQPVPALGCRFDPHTMKAVGFRSETGTGPGMVCEELRAGFVRRGRVLRPAEVIVTERDERERG